MAALDSPNVEIRFVFANYEKRVALTTTKTALGRELKQKLLEVWPEGLDNVKVV
jgi:hypothetical protein